MKLAGKVAVVTGGSRGIGFAIARAMGSHGAQVAIAARTASELEEARTRLEQEGIETLTRRVDVTHFEEVRALADDVLRQWGRIDVLVNNAGSMGAIGRIDECDLGEWRRAIEVNLFGTAHGCRAVLPHMRGQGSGVIVNFAGAGVGGPGVAPRVSAYAASKAAIVQLTESLAREVSGDGIRVNAVSPGPVVTEMTEAVVRAGPANAGSELYARTLEQRDRGGESPELAAALVVWLASDESGALTGKLLSAKWDKVASLDVEVANRSSLYALRRIDGVLFGELPRG